MEQKSRQALDKHCRIFLRLEMKRSLGPLACFIVLVAGMLLVRKGRVGLYISDGGNVQSPRGAVV